MLIVLDIDGVMVPATSWEKPEFLNDGFSAFSPRATSGLQKIILETNATIVLSTSHKFKYTLPQWKEMFKQRGIVISGIQRLEDNLTYLTRKEEILNWLNNNTDIKEYVIIDDDKSLNGLPVSIKDKLVLTSPMVGLTDESASLAIEILRKQNLISHST